MLSDDVVREVDMLAHRMGTNRSNLINQILAEYVNLTTPERRINDIFTAIEQLMTPFRDLVPFFSPNTFTMSLKSSLEYKYRPTVKYEVELYRGGGELHRRAVGDIPHPVGVADPGHDGILPPVEVRGGQEPGAAAEGRAGELRAVRRQIRAQHLRYPAGTARRRSWRRCCRTTSSSSTSCMKGYLTGQIHAPGRGEPLLSAAGTQGERAHLSTQTTE
jgi:hypothetical protein